MQVGGLIYCGTCGSYFLITLNFSVKQGTRLLVNDGDRGRCVGELSREGEKQTERGKINGLRNMV